MSDVIISADRLGKSYRIGQSAPRERYTALRDVLAGQARGLWHGARRGLRGEGRGARGANEEFWALRDVSFDIKRGEAVGIIGRNGAGKSTLLKILSRITEPTAGRVRLRGRVASLLEVGTGFHPELTGRENIFLNGAILGMSRAEIRRKFDEIVAFAEVDKFLDTPVKRYSSGMYVRLAFAVAAHIDPEILVVDEVLAVGDAAFQKRCLGKMQTVARSGRTVLFVSHNMAAISALCERAFMLESGRLLTAGPAATVVDRYWDRVLRRAESIAGQTFVSENGLIGITHCEASLEANDDNEWDLVIRVQVTSRERHRQIGVGFTISTLGGIQVCTIAPMMTNHVVSVIDGRVDCSFRCPSVTRFLAGGDYSLSLWLSRPRIETLVTAEHALRVSIPPSDPYEHGVYFEADRYGLVPLQTTFQAAVDQPALTRAEIV